MIGTHIIADAYDISQQTFRNLHLSYQTFDKKISALIAKHKMTILSRQIEIFDGNQGAFTCIYLLSQSHVSFHTWPENNYIAIDAFTCGQCDTMQLMLDILQYLNCPRHQISIMMRGKNCFSQANILEDKQKLSLDKQGPSSSPQNGIKQQRNFQIQTEAQGNKENIQVKS